MKIQSVRLGVIALLLLMSAVACNTTEDALPTVIDINDVVSQTSEAATRNAPTATNTPMRATLPPEFTPTPTETPTPTVVATATSLSSSGATGTIYYVYNGDSIAVVTPNGLTRDILITLGVGIPIDELVLAPNGEFFAYVAPANGQANEVYVSNLDNSYNQRITCLGFQHIKDVIWTPDGTSLTFFAAPTLGEALNIYSADIAGSVACPEGNQQRVLVPIGNPDARGLAWNLAGDLLFYGLGAPLFVYDTVTDTSTQYTYDTGAGPDFSPVHSPTDDRLIYLSSLRDDQGQLGGALAFIEGTNFIPDAPRPARAQPYNATGLVWSPDGEYLLVKTVTRLILIGLNGTIRDLSDTPLSDPQATFSPDGRYIAYTAPDIVTGVTQIYIYDRLTFENYKLTENPEGTITDLIWADVEL